MNKNFKKIIGVNFGLILILLEFCTYFIYRANPFIFFPGFINIEKVACNEEENKECTSERFHNSLGWNTTGEDPYGDGIRESNISKNYPLKCGAAFGDSFTYSNDVKPEYSWTSNLSNLMKCDIRNFGVGGYSYVQSYLKYDSYKPEEEIIIFLVYEEMLKRSLASSNYFIENISNRFIYPRPFLDRDRNIVQVPNPLNNKSLMNHVFKDWYSESPKLNFPYFLTLMRSIFFGPMTNPSFLHSQSYNTWKMRSDKLDFFEIYVDFAKKNIEPLSDKKILIAFLPASFALERNIDIQERIDEVDFGDICVSNPAKMMINLKESKDENLLGPTGHFNEKGELYLSQAIFNQISDCWPELVK